MWKSISTDQDFLFINIKLVDDIIVTYLTDLTTLWLEKLSKEQAHSRFKEQNPSFEVNAEESTEQILGLVDNNVETDKQVNTLIENEKRLAIKWHLDKLCINEITLPLLTSVKQQQMQIKEMRKLLEKKDREIEEYRMMSMDPIRDSLVTEKFDKTNFKDSANSVINAFESFPELWINFAKSHGLETYVAESDKVVTNAKPKMKVLSSRTSKRKQQEIFAYKSIKKERKM